MVVKPGTRPGSHVSTLFPCTVPLGFEGELAAPTLLHAAEFLCTGGLTDTHQQEALRQGGAALELVECAAVVGKSRRYDTDVCCGAVTDKNVSR